MSTALKLRLQPDGFALAIRKWLSGEVTGHLGAYMYTEDSDDHRWRESHSADSYYLGRDDKSTFDLVLDDLNITVKNCFDLGPGGEAAVKVKSLPLVTLIQAKTYYPFDLSSTLANAAAKLVGDRLNISGRPIVADFFEQMPIASPDTLLAFLGGTLGNLETHNSLKSLQVRLTGIFSNFRKATSSNSYFLVSFDANQKSQEIIDCYNSNEFNGLVRSCIERAINTDTFDYDVRWTPETHQLAMGLCSQYDQIIKFDGQEFPIEQGEFISVLNSYRYPVSFVQEAARLAGWKHQKTWSATGRVHYLLFSREQ